MYISRREAFLLAGSLGTVSLAGCTGFLSDDYLGLFLSNFQDREHELTVELFHPDADEYSEAIAYRGRFELSPHSDEEGPESDHQVLEEDIAESEPYIVSAELSTAPVASRTYRFYPSVTGDEERDDLLSIDIRTDHENSATYLSISQNR